jgi:RHS repeat-associated protein
VVENGVRKTYSARYYNPNTGRFMSRDPSNGYSRDPKSLHKYLYAGGDPANLIDPTGRNFVEDALTVGEIILKYAIPRAIGAMVAGVSADIATAASAGVEAALAIAEAAPTAEEAAAAVFQAIRWVVTTGGITRALLCGAVEFGLSLALDKYVGQFASDSVPSELKEAFEEACLGLRLGRGTH